MIFQNSLKSVLSLKLNDQKEAVFYANKATKLLDDYSSFNLKKIVYENQITLDNQLGDYKSAFYYQNQLLKIIEAKYSKDNEDNLEQLEVELDVTEKNNRIKNLQIGQLKKQVEINAKNNYLNYSIFGIIVMGLLVFYFIYNQKIIKNKNSLIKITNAKLANESDKTQKSLQEKETLLKEIHHRVKNNMQLVISLLKIQARDTKQLSIDDFILISENRIRSMALIHEYLYESENINFVNFEEYVKRLSSSIQSSFSGLQVQLETDIIEANFDI